MKTYRIEHTRPGADDPCDEWVPADVAQRLYEALQGVHDCIDETRGPNAYQALINARHALAAADGEEV